MGVKLQSSSGGSVEIAAPVTASNYVLTAPATNGTILNDASSLAAAMLTGNVDVARLVSAFSGSNVSLSSNGYQKLPSGLILQWGMTSSNYTTFPIAFPTIQVAVLLTGLSASADEILTVSGGSNTYFTHRGDATGFYFAVGY